MPLLRLSTTATLLLGIVTPIIAGTAGYTELCEGGVGLDAGACPTGKNAACRGPGGELDKINHRAKVMSNPGAATGACKDACDALGATCTGYTIGTTDGGTCILYGGGLDGGAEVGSCAKSGSPAGFYSSHSECDMVSGTWTNSASGWVGDSHPSKLVKGTATHTTGYRCFDADITDHEAKCVKNAESTATTCGTGAWTAAKSVENCPETDCDFSAEITEGKVIVPHTVVADIDGYTQENGACRSKAATGLDAKPNGKYIRGSDNSKGGLTVAQCEAACARESTCVGFHHGAWCGVYGDGLHTGDGQVTTAEESAVAGDWGPQEVDDWGDKTITHTKPNPAYVCFTRIPESPTTEAATTESGGDVQRLSKVLGLCIVVALAITQRLF